MMQQRCGSGLRNFIGEHIAGILCLGCLLFGALSCATNVAAEQNEPVPGKSAAWKPGKQTLLKGVKISLSQPVLVARRKGYLWFPTLTRMPDGHLLAVATNYADIVTESSAGYYTWSSDGGLSWSKPVLLGYCEASVQLDNGDVLLLPYYLHPAEDGAMVAPYILCPKGKQELLVKEKGLRVSGWPRPDQKPDKHPMLTGFVFNGQTLRLKDGTYAATLYGTFQGAKRLSLVMAESRDGRDWKIRSTIADEHCHLQGADGPSESALCRLQDGRLMCVFRVASNVPYGQTYSSDEGKTWTRPEAIHGPFSVQPSLQKMPDGTICLSSGRPGLSLWFNGDKQGREWEPVDIRANHNEFVKDEPIVHPGWNTSNYTEIVVLDDTHLLYLYDRLPHAAKEIPEKSNDTNSLWLIRVTIEKKREQ